MFSDYLMRASLNVLDDLLLWRQGLANFLCKKKNVIENICLRYLFPQVALLEGGSITANEEKQCLLLVGYHR